LHKPIGDGNILYKKRKFATSGYHDPRTSQEDPPVHAIGSCVEEAKSPLARRIHEHEIPYVPIGHPTYDFQVGDLVALVSGDSDPFWLAEISAVSEENLDLIYWQVTQRKVDGTAIVVGLAYGGWWLEGGRPGVAGGIDHREFDLIPLRSCKVHYAIACSGVRRVA
jgi:hypothetical protein